MNRRSRSARPLWPAVLLLVAAGVLAFALVSARPTLRADLYNLTGEENLLPQLKALTDLAAGALRPPLNLSPGTPIRHAGVNPFGVNVFLNEEVDPAKRELTVRLAAEAGFHWLRQEFPWEDIEIHAKGDFQDRRNQPYRSAWDKYDNIVELAEKYGMEVIVRVSTPPNWTRAAGPAAGAFAPPDDFEDFGDFVGTLVTRYGGRIRYYQMWNEPNIYPEWGVYPISPEDYTQLLRIAATRARAADPEVVVISGALASTISLDAAAPPPNNALNDLLFLQRMYDAGAAPYFDIMAMQAYGLWSGPSDRRMQPRVMNYGRPQYVRDLMVANGDAAKPIWISEMAWSAVPDDVPDKRFGQVTPEQQARYTVDAYRRAIQEWPWIGVVNTWYFKRATDQWVTERKPEAYFRLADPDFTLQPVYHALKEFTAGYEPVLYQGAHAADHWGVTRTGAWSDVAAPGAPFGRVWQSEEAGSQLSFSFEGRELAVSIGCANGGACSPLRISIDGGPDILVEPAGGVTGGGVPVARKLAEGIHQVVITVDPSSTSPGAPAGIAAIVVR